MDKVTNRIHPVTQMVTIPTTHNQTYQEDIIGVIKRQRTHTMVATDNTFSLVIDVNTVTTSISNILYPLASVMWAVIGYKIT